MEITLRDVLQDIRSLDLLRQSSAGRYINRLVDDNELMDKIKINTGNGEIAHHVFEYLIAREIYLQMKNHNDGRRRYMDMMTSNCSDTVKKTYLYYWGFCQLQQTIYTHSNDRVDQIIKMGKKFFMDTIELELWDI